MHPPGTDFVAAGQSLDEVFVELSPLSCLGVDHKPVTE